MKIISAFLMVLSFSFCYAQSSGEITDMRKVMTIARSSAHYHTYIKNNTNEFQFLFSGIFMFYKTFISSQDGQSCSFTPSCSEYGMLAVKKIGTIHGVINTFDRLMRCHGLAPELYKKDPVSGLLIDLP